MTYGFDESDIQDLKKILNTTFHDIDISVESGYNTFNRCNYCDAWEHEDRKLSDDEDDIAHRLNHKENCHGVSLENARLRLLNRIS